MEKDTSTPDPQKDSDFKRHYNIGRFLAANEPTTAKELADLPINAPIIDGIRAGKESYEREQREKGDPRPEWLRREPVSNTFNDKSSRDKGLDER